MSLVPHEEERDINQKINVKNNGISEQGFEVKLVQDNHG
jgi:hypothetical protein